MSAEEQESNPKQEVQEKETPQKEGPTKKLHMLKDSWSVFYIPSKREGDDYVVDLLGSVDSLEGAFAILNTMPKVTILPPDDNLVFSRNGVEPRYENFTEGISSIQMYVNPKNQGEDAAERLLCASLGEWFPKEAGESVVQVVRFAHKFSRFAEHTVRLEIWFKDEHASLVQSHIKTELLTTVPSVKILPARSLAK
ncbi:hypothetical protein AGDE_03513 [Angomonas deanei]|uniref:Eukaryotic initiation factor 4E, putative n=1 Tax=Angomonas deanei TaxID=59799 RepID=A0A7G2CCR3_9TRYP|nr:hypothetical protein AGDE_03513 [Angomonas deanei]CAD2215902.1 Eukaryotic initiation factor 4E, putative [Angomonas deanei]|eukprot:EPY40415.1 hypothetical protein AGDE_03513 [Angomonas deanei]